MPDALSATFVEVLHHANLPCPQPRAAPPWRYAHRHFAAFVEIYPHDYQSRLGPLRPVIPQVVHKFLDRGNLDRGFAKSGT